MVDMASEAQEGVPEVRGKFPVDLLQMISDLSVLLVYICILFLCDRAINWNNTLYDLTLSSPMRL